MTDPEKIEQAKQKIVTCTEMLKNGISFGEVAQKYSEDAGSAKNGGQMRWLRSGELPPNIEEQVFALKDSGDFTEPVQSDYGWHIFQLQGKRPVASFDKMKSQLEERIMQDERGKIIEQAKIAEIKKESGYIEYPGNLETLTRVMDTMVYSGTWKPQASGNLIEPVFRIGNREYSQMDLALFIVQNKRYRREESLDQITRRKGDEYINRELMAFEKSRLEEKYPDFRYLMEEYHDGILLFNITDDLVWSKAVKDSAGLEAFFKQHQGDYYWKERADISVYFLKDKSKLDQVSKLARQRSAKKWTSSEFINLICPGDSLPCLTVTDGRLPRRVGRRLPRYPGKSRPRATRTSGDHRRDAGPGDAGDGPRDRHRPQARLPDRLRLAGRLAQCTLPAHRRQRRGVAREPARRGRTLCAPSLRAGGASARTAGAQPEPRCRMGGRAAQRAPAARAEVRRVARRRAGRQGRTHASEPHLRGAA